MQNIMTTSARRKLQVFITEDSAEVRNRLNEILKENGSIEVIGEAEDAGQAMHALAHLRVDVVILDIHMPGGGSMRALRAIKATDPGRIVIIFTAFAYPQYRQAYLGAGADYFFDKTSEVQQMTDALAALAQRRIIGRKDQ